jgi:hypothetical protein
MQENLIKDSFIHSFSHSFIHSVKGRGRLKGKNWYGKSSGIGIEKREGKEEKDWLGKVEGRSRE